MRRSRLGFTLLSSAALLGGCAATTMAPPPAPAAPADRIDTDSSAARASEGPRDEALATALERAIDDSSEWPSLHLFAECRRDAGLESIEIFGNGVAIRNGKGQFEVSGTEIAALLAAFEKADFAAMPAIFGGKKKPQDLETTPRPPGGQEGIFALRVICRVELSVGGHSKMVAQLDEGDQSETLKGLAEEFFRVCEEPARAAVGALDLIDGLAKIGSGELAPETLHLMLHRKPEPNEPVSSEGFLLRLDGLKATSRPVAPGGADGTGRALVLSPGELATLARELGGRATEDLPQNLYASEYTDLSIEVLDRKKSIQARQFAGMEPTTHGESQKRFDGIYELLVDLHRRVMADGSAVLK